ncbi:MAG: N-acetylmuramoyl-L-alanine amidase [Lachnospiraceae bacterium]|nr:N-acetylmuramoyl-L-alanine amidase [Lachnospiraceae bacterium]
MTIILLLAAAIVSRKEALVIAESKEAKPVNEKCIVIDAGHGGDDPGKIGINGSLEKDINLVIAHKLKVLLESQDYEVIMTRSDSKGLYSAGAQNKKAEDMHNRCEIITEAMPIFTVSIHQNSYPEEYVKGAQVFYYGQSKEGEALAKKIQTSMVTRLDPENHRVEKANESYYLLKKTPTPTVIVECGFLSNSEEAELLNTEEYQDKVAWAIMMGIVQHLSEG